MVEEELCGILTVQTGLSAHDTSRRWSKLSALGWELAKAAEQLGYYLFLRPARYEVNEWDMLSKVDRDAIQLMWKRMPKMDDTHARLYFAVLSSPLDDTAGDELARELGPPIVHLRNESANDFLTLQNQVRIFQFLREIWGRPEVVGAIFAAFTWETSWPHLEERKCTFEEMIEDLYSWFNEDGRWVDKTYYLSKVGPPH